MSEQTRPDAFGLFALIVMVLTVAIVMGILMFGSPAVKNGLANLLGLG